MTLLQCMTCEYVSVSYIAGRKWYTCSANSVFLHEIVKNEVAIVEKRDKE